MFRVNGERPETGWRDVENGLEPRANGIVLAPGSLHLLGAFEDGPGEAPGLHELRHTVSTVIYNRTVDLNASRAQLGPTKESMTIDYTHPEDERGLEAVDAAYAAQVVPLRRREAS